jgi:SPP1 gp7 family putative phage head morphogenesis protein
MQMNQNDIDKYLDDLISKAEKDIDKVYLKRLEALYDQLASMYRKYSVNGELNYTDMTKYNRLKKELALIVEKLHGDYKQLAKMIRDLQVNQYIENYFRTAYLFEFTAQQNLGFEPINMAAIQSAIQNTIPELSISAVLERNRDDIVRRISIEITQGLLAGETYSEMAKRIERVIGFGAKKSRAVARTEAHRAQIQGRMDSAKQASKHITLKKMWDATLDRETRKAHRKLDGTIKELDEDFVSINGGKGPAPSFMRNASDDINCRCSLIFTIGNEWPEVKRARLEDGRTIVIPYTTYDDWIKGRIGSKIKRKK